MDSWSSTLLPQYIVLYVKSAIMQAIYSCTAYQSHVKLLCVVPINDWTPEINYSLPFISSQYSSRLVCSSITHSLSMSLSENAICFHVFPLYIYETPANPVIHFDKNVSSAASVSVTIIFLVPPFMLPFGVAYLLQVFLSWYLFLTAVISISNLHTYKPVHGEGGPLCP